MRRQNKYLEALKEGGNVLGLTTAVALSAATLNPLPLLVGLVVEAAYLIFVPDSKWFEARLARKHDGEIEKRREQLKAQVLPTLREEVRQRFLRLEEIRRQIGAAPMEGDQEWFRQVLRKLDFLLEKFLHFAQKDMQFRVYLASVLAEQRGEPVDTTMIQSTRLKDQVKIARVANGQRGPRQQHPAPSQTMERARRNDPDDRWVQRTITDIQASYDGEMAEVRAQVEGEHDYNTRQVLEKRLEVLQRRHEFVARIAKILTNLTHQLKLLEDSFGLINDELRAQSPEQVLADIDDVVSQTNMMTGLLEEVAPFERLLDRMST